MKYLFIFAFVGVYYFFGLELGYTVTSPWWTHVTYMFQHANVWHLLLNSFSWWVLFKALERFYRPWVIAAGAMLVAVVASWLCVYSVPTVGASGMIYALMGAFLMLVATGKLVYRRRADLILLIVSVVTFLVIGFIKHNSAGLLHLLCLVAGFGFTFKRKLV